MVQGLNSQTHFTIPQNVVRVSLGRDLSSQRWIGKGGEEGLPDEFFAVRGPFFGPDSVLIEGEITNPGSRRTQRLTRFILEYGISDRITFFWDVPFVTSLSENNSWGWNSIRDSLSVIDEDTVASVIDSLMAFYHPNRSISGLGDVGWGLNAVLWGSPAWAGESILSVYAGIGMKLSSGRIIGSFGESDVDTSGRPKQFRELPLGNGVIQWQLSLFGEFYREIFERLIRVNWKLGYWLNHKGKFFTRISPRGNFTLDHREILQEVGRVFRMKPGNVFFAEIVGFLELIPDRLSANASQSWVFKARDSYQSGSKTWDEWMEGGTNEHRDYDTREFRIVQSVGLLVHNIHPLKKFGPVPFEVEARMDLPFLTRYTWRRVAFRVSVSIYLQLW